MIPQTFITIPLNEWEKFKSEFSEISQFVRNQKSTLGNDRLLSIKEVAAMVGRSESRVREWIRLGKLDAVQKHLGETENRKTVMVRESVLNVFMQSDI
jgi:hypothetical protein